MAGVNENKAYRLCSHLDSILTSLADREKVRDNEGHQVCAHLHTLIKLILKQTIWKL